MGYVDVVERCVAQQSQISGVVMVDVLAYGVHDVHPKAVDTSLEPEAQGLTHGISDLWIGPIEVGLISEKHVKVVLTRQLVPGPRGLVAPGVDPIVRQGPVRLRVTPDVPVPVPARA